MTVTKICDQSKLIVVGTVTRVNPDNRVVEVRAVERIRGEAALATGQTGSTFRIQIPASAAPAELLGQVAASQPVVLFVSRERDGAVGVVHIADTWPLAERVANASPPAWRVSQVADLRSCFPGRTGDLAAVLGEIKRGKSTLLDQADVEVFKTVRRLGRLAVTRPESILAVRLRREKEAEPTLPELIVWSAGQFRLFVWEGQHGQPGEGYKDASATWGGPWASKSAVAAAGETDGDGRVELLLGNRLFGSDSGKLIPAGGDFGDDCETQLLASALVRIPGRLAATRSPGSVETESLDRTGTKGSASPPTRLQAVFVVGSQAEGQAIIFESSGSADHANRWIRVPDRSLWRSATTAPDAKRAPWASIGNWAGRDTVSVLVITRGTGAAGLPASGGPVGVVRYPLSSDGGGPADLARLTGQLTLAGKLPAPPHLHAVRIDVNGDGLDDLLLCSSGQTGGVAPAVMLLINRGFGAFLASQSAGPAITPSPDKPASFELPAGCVWTAADLAGKAEGSAGRQGLLILSADGELTAIENAGRE